MLSGGQRVGRSSTTNVEGENNMAHRLPTPHYRAPIIILFLLSLVILVPELRAQDTWNSFMGPDGDFTISFPDVPSRETNVTPQRTFTGQTTTLFSSKTG